MSICHYYTMKNKMINEYDTWEIVDLVVERKMTKLQIGSLINSTELKKLPTLSETSEWKELNNKLTLLENALYERGGYNQRHLDMYEQSLYKRGLI